MGESAQARGRGQPDPGLDPQRVADRDTCGVTACAQEAPLSGVHHGMAVVSSLSPRRDGSASCAAHQISSLRN